MSKTIVFCADGTWNGPPEHTNVSALDDADSHGELAAGAVTNVVKLFANLAGRVTPDTLALQNEQEKVLLDASGNPLQWSKYIHGVGDSRNLAIRLLGGTLGMGVIDRIVRGYTFLSRVYEPDDDIHLVGFSRGAYTVRALAGMIAQVGLLDRSRYDVTDKRHAYQLGVAAWCKAKRASLSVGELSKMANGMLGFLEAAVAARLRNTDLIPHVPMASVAVWDTVGALGIPKYADNERFDVLRFTDSKLSPMVARGFHAMAIDELRLDFPVAKWDPRDGVEQVWFVGAHSDVGGGYPATECYLSDIAFDWMMTKLAAERVRFETPLMHTPNPHVLGGPYHTPWSNPPFNLQEQSPRAVEAGDVLHATVKERWAASAPPLYRPDALRELATEGFEKFTFDPPAT